MKYTKWIDTAQATLYALKYDWKYLEEYQLLLDNNFDGLEPFDFEPYAKDMIHQDRYLAHMKQGLPT